MVTIKSSMSDLSVASVVLLHAKSVNTRIIKMIASAILLFFMPYSFAHVGVHAGI